MGVDNIIVLPFTSTHTIIIREETTIS